MSYYAVMSDIHGNLFALEAICEDLRRFDIDGIFLLGDLIDYGMQSNETISYLRREVINRYPIMCNIRGNHEQAILLNEYDRFSSERGKDCARYTSSILTQDSFSWLNSTLDESGKSESEICGKKILAVHGSLEDVYWKSIFPQELRGDYREYDLVLSGHSHQPHIFSIYYECEAIKMRGKKKVTFINPGSVGQPRNHNPNASYAIFDPVGGMMMLRSVQYDVDAAMALYHGQVDDFYRSRLEVGV